MVRDEKPQVDEAQDTADEGHPAGEIRLSPARALGLRVSVLGGLAVGAIIADTPTMSLIHPTSGP